MHGRTPATNAGGGIEGAQGAAHDVLQRAFDRPAVVQPHLRLGRMHVDIHIAGGEREIEHERRSQPRWQGGPVGRFGGSDQSGITHDATVHDEQHAAGPGADIGGALDQTARVQHAVDVVDVDETCDGLGPPECGEPRA
jgi:hypothetical protein